MKNTGGDINTEQAEMECEVVNDIYVDRSTGKTTDVVEERADDLRRECRIPYDMKEQTPDLVGPKKRNPNAPVVGQALKATVRSRYRCPSTGSCHDICKYGHRTELKKEAKKPVLGTIRESRPLIRTSSGDKLSKSVPEKDAKDKSSLSRRLSHPGQISEKNRMTQTENVNSSEGGVAPNPPQPKIKRVQNETKPPAVLISGSSFSRSKIDVPAGKKALQVKTSRKVRENKTKEARSSSESRNGKAKEPMSHSPRTLLKKSPSIKATLLKNFRSFSRSRRLSISEDAKSDKPRDVPDKAEHVIEPDEESLVSSTTKKGNRFGLPSFSSSSAPKSAASAARQTSEEKNGSVWKVKFRRGTVVNIQTASSSPKKLRFRRGRILGQDQNDKIDARKGLKKIDDLGNESADIKPEHEKVLLRRQEGAVKKDSIDLNNVIKETASKLVKTRKSRVKALVGAFESVMSFRDRKPLVETTVS
ncbi:hypothetical protein RND81_02G036500 [Saponaria officinalis]|uniref:Calmodulin-binding domain-containing protein n=1 Tax=Saponaria officinalis TaxID=3572 RepID=A0AAW1MQ50_SAPOF